MDYIIEIKLLFIYFMVIIKFIIEIILPYNYIKNNTQKIFLNIIMNIIFKKIEITGDILNINDKNGKIFVSNHYSYEEGTFMQSYIDNLYIIAKNDIFNSSINNYYMNNISKKIYNTFNWIPYIRGNKNSGINVRKKIMCNIKKNNNILVFPEGTSLRDGPPKKFYNGIFELCEDNNIILIPVAFYCYPNIGIRKGDKINLRIDLKKNPILYIHFFCKSLESITLHNSVKSIGNCAFRQCYLLKSIKLGNQLKSINEWTFADCVSLKSITIPKNIKSIGNYAFYNCNLLTSIELGNNIESIGDYAFYYCNSLISITLPKKFKVNINYIHNNKNTKIIYK